MNTHWTNPRHNGQGSWRHTTESDNSLTALLIALIACVLMCVVFIALVVAGRAVMCASHDGALSYCTQEQPR